MNGSKGRCYSRSSTISREQTHPLSTRKESLHTFGFLFTWNLEKDTAGPYLLPENPRKFFTPRCWRSFSVTTVCSCTCLQVCQCPTQKGRTSHPYLGEGPGRRCPGWWEPDRCSARCEGCLATHRNEDYEPAQCVWVCVCVCVRLHAALLNVGSSDEERDSDVKLIGHRFTCRCR